MSDATAVQRFELPTGDGHLRVITIDGTPMLSAGDLCAALELGDTRQAVGRLDDDEYALVAATLFSAPSQTVGRGGARQAYAVTESGMYALIMGSRKPEAKAFKRWVTHEVLPSIRRTGSYGVAVPQTYAEALKAHLDEVLRREALERVALEQAQELEVARPRAAYVDAFVDPTGDAKTVRVVAQQLGVKEHALRDYLVGMKRVYRVKHGPENEYQPYATYAAWFVVRDQPEAPRRRNGQMRTTLYVTPAGCAGIARLLARHPIGG